MAQTLYATFPDVSLAEKAAGALMDHGIRSEDISLVSKSTGGTVTNPDGNTVDTNANWNTANNPNWNAANNPNWNAADTRAAQADMNATGYTPASTTYPTAVDTDTMPATHVNRDIDTDYDTAKTIDNTDLAAKTGFSTTTGPDAGVGAAKGAAIGLGIGVLAALAALAIPGFGLVAGGGALATAIGGAAGATVGGAVAGGVYGYLVDQGVSEQAAQVYNQAYEQGGAIMAIHINPNDIDQATVESMLTKYGATNINTFAA